MAEIKEIFYKDVLKYENELKNLINMTLLENYRELYTDKLFECFYESLIKYSLDGSAVLLGAFEKDQLVGFQWAHERMFLEKRRMHSYMIAVELEYRNCHIGSDLLSKLEEVAVSRGICEIEAICKANNPIAVNYHLHNAFLIESYKVVKNCGSKAI